MTCVNSVFFTQLQSRGFRLFPLRCRFSMARRSTSVPPWSRAVSRSESDPKLGGGGASASSAPWDRPRGRATEDRVRRSGGASAASAPPLQSPDESMGDRPYCLAHYWDEKRGQYHYTDTISGLSSWNKEELLATIKKAPWKTKSEDVITAPTDIGQSRGLLAYTLATCHLGRLRHVLPCLGVSRTMLGTSGQV